VDCAVPVYYSGRAATVEGWLTWLEGRWDGEPDAAVAVIGGIVAGLWGRPAEAERWADAAERGTHDGALPDGSASIDSWLALLRAQNCDRGVARMRTDAELTVATVPRGSQFRPSALIALAVSHWLAGELDQADDLFADAAEVGLELGADAAATGALGERALIASGRGAWVAAGELTDRALPVMRRSRSEEYPSSAHTYAVAARVALHRGNSAACQELLTRAQRLRLRLTYAIPWLAVQTRLELARAYLTLADAGGAATMLREIDAISRRRPDLGTLRGQADEVRTSLRTLRTHAPGASTLTEAELHLLPYLATHLSFREIGERLYLSRHTVKSHAMAIYRKLSVASRNAAVDRARELTLL
jgi:LuxR family transcriptional regulator, maltose regulon positive regulatory protein